MRTEVFAYLPKEAREIREEVFIKEQGFAREYDEIDEIATHIVLFEENFAVGTCRIFSGEAEGVYILGRLAVSKEERGKGIGSRILAAAEAWVEEKGGNCLKLHSQLHAKVFYEKAGYTAVGEVDYEEDCPHIWMKKEFLAV